MGTEEAEQASSLPSSSLLPPGLRVLSRDHGNCLLLPSSQITLYPSLPCAALFWLPSQLPLGFCFRSPLLRQNKTQNLRERAVETIGMEHSCHWVLEEGAPFIQMNRLRYKKVPSKVTGVHSMPLPSLQSFHWLFDAPWIPECLLQGHCTCCFLCLESSFARISEWLPLSHSFKSLLKYPSFEAFPDYLLL